MTRLLVSVRDAAEAQDALAAGAHFLDIKEPERGPLGAADPQVWRSVRAAVSARCPLSAALGELRDFAAHQVAALDGFRFAKIGLSGCAACHGWWHDWSAAMRQLPPGVGSVAVAYADHAAACAPSPEDVLRIGGELGCAALLIDTFDKRSGSLFAHYRPPSLQTLLEQARDRSMLVVLGGSLNEQCGEAAARLRPDYLAVRGAVCGHGRKGPLKAERVRWWVDQLADWSNSRPPSRRSRA